MKSEQSSVLVNRERRVRQSAQFSKRVLSECGRRRSFVFKLRCLAFLVQQGMDGGLEPLDTVQLTVGRRRGWYVWQSNATSAVWELPLRTTRFMPTMT